MIKAYVAISGIIFVLVALWHVVRLVQGWQVQVGPAEIPMSLSWIALAVSIGLALWGAAVLRR